MAKDRLTFAQTRRPSDEFISENRRSLIACVKIGRFWRSPEDRRSRRIYWS
jgi:hypothetical protein